MPDISALMKNASKKKFKKSSYRPWNYLEEMEKEENDKKEASESYSVKTSSVCQENSLQKTSMTEASLTSRAQKDKVIQQSLSKNTNDNHMNRDHVSPIYIILRLSGYQKIIFTFVFEKCLSRGSLSSGVVTSEVLTTLTNTTLTMVNTSIQRLVDKGLLSRENGKRGRGGFYCFGITQEVKDAAIEYKRLANPDLELHKSIDVNMDCLEPEEIDHLKNAGILPPDWDEIDIEPLSPINFSRGHLIQLYKLGSLDAHSIQDSVNHFAFDLKYNNKNSSITKSTPIGYFMGILKRSGLYNAPENYESPKDRAIREMLAHKKMEKQKRDNMVREMVDLEFPKWRKTLDEAEISKIVPADVLKTNLSPAITAALRAYFTDTILIPEVENIIVK